jgi:hypothetical protein
MCILLSQDFATEIRKFPRVTFYIQSGVDLSGQMSLDFPMQDGRIWTVFPPRVRNSWPQQLRLVWSPTAGQLLQRFFQLPKRLNNHAFRSADDDLSLSYSRDTLQCSQKGAA